MAMEKIVRWIRKGVTFSLGQDRYLVQHTARNGEIAQGADAIAPQ